MGKTCNFRKFFHYEKEDNFMLNFWEYLSPKKGIDLITIEVVDIVATFLVYTAGH